jgi:hypothetical protein
MAVFVFRRLNNYCRLLSDMGTIWMLGTGIISGLFYLFMRVSAFVIILIILIIIQNTILQLIHKS